MTRVHYKTFDGEEGFVECKSFIYQSQSGRFTFVLAYLDSDQVVKRIENVCGVYVEQY